MIVRCFVQNLTVAEAKKLVEDLVDELSQKDIDSISSLPNFEVYEDNPPSSLIDLSAKEKELLISLLDRISATNKEAVEKVKEEICKGKYKCEFKKKK